MLIKSECSLFSPFDRRLAAATGRVSDRDGGVSGAIDKRDEGGVRTGHRVHQTGRAFIVLKYPF